MKTVEFITFLFENWDKIILLIGMIGFFVRELFKLDIKKKEIKFLYYHSKETSSINEYINAYYNFKKAMKNFPIDFFDKGTKNIDIDKLTTEYLDELRRCDFIIGLYIKEDLYKKYKTITEESESLTHVLHTLILDQKLDFLEKCNRYDKAFREYNEKLNNISSIVFSATRKEIK